MLTLNNQFISNKIKIIYHLFYTLWPYAPIENRYFFDMINYIA